MTSGVPEGRNLEVTGSNPVEVRIFSGFSSISKIASITARIIAYLTTVVIIMQICDVLRGCAPCCVGLPTPLIAAERGPKSATVVVLLPISAILFHQYKWVSEKHEQWSRI